MQPPPFVGEEWTTTDLRRTVATMRTRFRWVVDGLPPVDGLAELSAELAALTESIPAATAGRTDLETAVVSGDAIVREAATLVAPNRPDPGGPGTVVGLFRSNGGVPKAPIDTALVGHRGVEGDRQATRQHHGRVWQALCLWSAEVIDALRAEGHPLAPGAAGENITIAGLDWPAVRPGLRLDIGDVAAELSAYSPPCAQNAQWFTGGDVRRIDPDLRPGWSRVYAWVGRGGTVHVGDAVTVVD